MNGRQTDLPKGITGQSPVYTGPVSGQEQRLQAKSAALVRQQNVQITITPIQVETVSRQIMGRNDSRRYLAFQNQSPSDVYINFGRPASTGASSFLLPSGGTYLMESGIVPNTEIFAVGAAGLILTVIEGSAF